MDSLTNHHCVPCEGGVEPLKRTEFETYLEQVHDWTVVNDIELMRDLKFSDFTSAIVFMNKVAEIAESEGHHPDIFLHNWNHVRFNLTTHAIGGLSINDFVMASKIDQLLLQ